MPLTAFVAEGGWLVTQGRSVALSADGNTAIVGGSGDNRGIGAAWVYTRSGTVWRKRTVWTQQGKLVGTGAIGFASQGASVALSADGNTAIVGGPNDTGGFFTSSIGAAWVFVQRTLQRHLLLIPELKTNAKAVDSKISSAHQDPLPLPVVKNVQEA